MAVVRNQNRQVHTANRISFRIAGLEQSEIGLGQNVRINTDPQLQDASGIGDNIVKEWVPGQYRVQVTVGLMALRTASLYLDAIPATGAGCLEGWEFDISILDKEGGSSVELRKVIGCVYAGGDLEIQKHAILGTNITFYGRDTTGSLVGNAAATAGGGGGGGTEQLQ